MLQRPGFRHFVANLPGTTHAERLPSIPGRLDPYFATSPDAVLIDDGGTYDLEDAHSDLTAAGLLTLKTAYTAARRAAGADYIVGMTIPPSGFLTGDENTQRLTYNAAIVANPATYGYDQVVNLAAIPELEDNTNLTYYSDGTHYTSAATTLVANALLATGI